MFSAYDDKQRQKREEINSRSLFTPSHTTGSDIDSASSSSTQSTQSSTPSPSTTLSKSPGALKTKHAKLQHLAQLAKKQKQRTSAGESFQSLKTQQLKKRSSDTSALFGIIKKPKCSVGEDELTVNTASDGKMDQKVELAKKPDLEDRTNDQQESSVISENLDSENAMKSHKLLKLSNDPEELDKLSSREKALDKIDIESSNMGSKAEETLKSTPNIVSPTYHTISPKDQTESIAVESESPASHAALGTLLANYASSDSSEED